MNGAGYSAPQRSQNRRSPTFSESRKKTLVRLATKAILGYRRLARRQEFCHGSRRRPISHAMLNPTPNEITLAANKIRKWTSPGIMGHFLSKKMLNPRTITIGGSVHHLDTRTVGLRTADI
jgi:hypothetical protein